MCAMNTCKIRSFINNVLPNLKPEILWIPDRLARRVFQKHHIEFGVGVSRTKNRLYINKKFWRSKSVTVQKSLLLHELGHTRFKHKRFPPVKEELIAQLWALHKAQELDMPKVENETLDQLCRWDCKENWNNKHDRRYALASRMAFKYGIKNLIKKWGIKNT